MAFTKLAGGMTKAQNKVTFTDKNGNKRVFIAKPRKSKYATTRLMVKALRGKGLSDKFIAQAVMKREKCKKEVALKLIEKLAPESATKKKSRNGKSSTKRRRTARRGGWW